MPISGGYYYPVMQAPTLGYKFGQIASGTLPAGSSSLSGAVFWLTDLKSPVIYGPNGWVRILTGAI